VCERIPFLIFPVKQLSRELPDKTPGLSRPNHPPMRRERAVGQDAGAPRTIRRSAASEPSGKTLGPSRFESPAEAPRASHWVRRQVHLEWNPPSKRRERAVGQDSGPASNHPPKRYTSEPSGKPPGPSRTASTTTQAAAYTKPSTQRSVEQAVAAEPRTIRRSSRSWRAPPIPNRTPYIIRCESLNGGRTWKDCHGGCYSCIITKRRRRPCTPHLLRDYRET